MDYKKLIIITIDVLIGIIFIFISYKSYVREKYFSKKAYIWSNRDKNNKNLKGYHAYEKPLTPICIILIYFSQMVKEYSKILSIALSIVFVLIIIYVIISYVKIRTTQTN